jgi:hypothetical protein
MGLFMVQVQEQVPVHTKRFVVHLALLRCPGADGRFLYSTATLWIPLKALSPEALLVTYCAAPAEDGRTLYSTDIGPVQSFVYSRPLPSQKVLDVVELPVDARRDDGTHGR